MGQCRGFGGGYIPAYRRYEGILIRIGCEQLRLLNRDNWFKFLPMELSKGVKALVAEAMSQVQTLSPAEVDARLSRTGVLLVDLRDVREVKRDGKIPDALHVPRGMLEFWIDPDSPYYRTEFDAVEEVILYCNKGSRSALAAQSLQSMGIEKVAHMDGGFERWLTDIGRQEGPA